MSNYTAPTGPSATSSPPGVTGSPTLAHGGPPYLPQAAQLGGAPSIAVDVPICSVLLSLFVIGAAMNMTIFQVNRRHGYRFLFSGLLFGFCMARIVALSMRIAWSAYPRDINVAIASQIFTAAGVLLLFVTNLIFAQRMIRAYHPFFGWARGTTFLFRFLFVSIVLVLVMVITVSVQSFFTLDHNTRRIDRDIQLFCATYLAVIAFLPIPIVLVAALVPRRTRIDKFGQGHFRTKFGLLTFTATLLAAGAIFRAANSFAPPRPLDDPAWYQSKACYFCFNFVIELVVVFTYALSRFDRRFHVPNGSSAPGHYSCSEYSGGGGGSMASAVAAAIAVADFEKQVAYSKRSSAWSGKSGGGASTLVGGGGHGIGVGGNGGYTIVGGAGRRSIKSSGGARSIRSVYAAAPLVNEATPSETDSITRDADMAWMARAMASSVPAPSPLISQSKQSNADRRFCTQRELYGEEDEHY
ncbi:hypothetical protein B0H63DRAFT_130643 [Podospora didyma]|uniref:Uncharacterized protein n=1 Tax=Podospora didyma TaxID=330526 RepID=A0AAE0P0A4_9PEZI|nr:hypothetical protein B0H63DRAFT_130643 [Podospora didyma]